MQKRMETPEECFLSIEEQHDLRVALRVEIPNCGENASSIVQRISLEAHSSMIEFHCQVNWKEKHKILKVEFPLAIRSDYATYEVPFGHLRRPTHFNTSRDLGKSMMRMGSVNSWPNHESH